MDEERAMGTAAGDGAEDAGPDIRRITEDWYGDDRSMAAEPEQEKTPPEPDGAAGDRDGGGQAEGLPETAEREADQSFRLKYMGQEVEVTREEMIRLAQKGRDYDRIRSRADALADSLRENSGYMSFLEALADRSGQSLEEFVGKVSAAMGLPPPEAPGGGKSAPPPAGAEQEPSPEAQDAGARRDREVAEFLAEYGTVDPQSIPGEVWEAVKAGKSLLTAYQGYENRLLKARIDAESKNLENRLKSAGSRATGGAARPRSEIEDDWYNDN